MTWGLPRAAASAMLLALSLAAWGAPSAAAQEPDPQSRLTEIREMVLYARYGEALEAVDAVLAREDLEPSDRNAALEIRATILIARNQQSAAQEVLTELYRRDPEHRLNDRDASPRVRAAFERAHDSAGEPATVTITSETPGSLPARRPPVISVRLTDGADLAQEVRVSYRIGDSGAFERVIMRFGETRTEARSRIPPADGTDAYQVQYFVEALAPSLAVMGTLASRAEPLTLDIPAAAAPDLTVREDPTLGDGDPLREGAEPPGGESILKKWWFWTLVGVVIVGAGVGLGVGLGGSGQPDPGSLGEGSL